jgi:SanA protein
MSKGSVPHILMISLFIIVVGIPILVLQSGRSNIYTSINSVKPTPVAIVFGAGLTINNAPSDALMDRLTVAATLYTQGKVSKILVSGDNWKQEYNEPEVMKQTLLDEFLVPEDVIATDYAGRRTYDTCRRAHDLWGVDQAILVSQGYHLPRAIWTCEVLGIQSTGISATLQPYIKEMPFKLREVGAIYKAFIDLYILEPEYISGEFIQDIDP